MGNRVTKRRAKAQSTALQVYASPIPEYKAPPAPQQAPQREQTHEAPHKEEQKEQKEQAEEPKPIQPYLDALSKGVKPLPAFKKPPTSLDGRLEMFKTKFKNAIRSDTGVSVYHNAFIEMECFVETPEELEAIQDYLASVHCYMCQDDDMSSYMYEHLYKCSDRFNYITKMARSRIISFRKGGNTKMRIAVDVASPPPESGDKDVYEFYERTTKMHLHRLEILRNMLSRKVSDTPDLLNMESFELGVDLISADRLAEDTVRFAFAHFVETSDFGFLVRSYSSKRRAYELVKVQVLPAQPVLLALKDKCDEEEYSLANT